MNIAVVGGGYVGLSNALLLSQNNNVKVQDIDPMRVAKINAGESYINEKEIDDFLKNRNITLQATLDVQDACKDANFVIVATPTDYDIDTNFFNTDSVDQAIRDINAINPKAAIVIKSTIPVGYTSNIKIKYNIDNIFYSPEFLREGYSLYDNLYPSRIIVGDKSSVAKEFTILLQEGAIKKILVS